MRELIRGMRFNLVKTLIGSIFLAAFLFFFIKPREDIVPSWLNFLIIVLLQLTALVVTQVLTPGTIRGIVIRALVVSFLFSLFVVFILQPSGEGFTQFSQTYIMVTAVEFASVVAAVILIHPGMH